MKKLIFVVLLFHLQFFIKAQDSTLIGRFAFSALGSYSKTNISEEKAKGGFGIDFRYFPKPKGAFVLSYQNINSSILRFGVPSQASNYSVSGGFEKHFPVGGFSPYLGSEVGLNFTKVKSVLIKDSSNSQYFQNNVPNFLVKPKIGLFYKINDNLNAQFQGTYNWIFSSDRQNTNPLFDSSYKAIYFGRKAATVSVGILYLFNE